MSNNVVYGIASAIYGTFCGTKPDEFTIVYHHYNWIKARIDGIAELIPEDPDEFNFNLQIA